MLLDLAILFEALENVLCQLDGADVQRLISPGVDADGPSFIAAKSGAFWFYFTICELFSRKSEFWLPNETFQIFSKIWC